VDFDRSIDIVTAGEALADLEDLGHRVAEEFLGEQTNVGLEKATLQQVNPTRAYTFDVFQPDLADVGEHVAPMTIEVGSARTHLNVPALRGSGTVTVHIGKARRCSRLNRVMVRSLRPLP
jgi:hypothetical protein